MKIDTSWQVTSTHFNIVKNKRLWRPCLLKPRNLYAPLIKACMRQGPHNRTFWKDCSCVHASERVVPNPSTPRVRTLADKSIFSPLRCTRRHFPCRLPASRFTRWFGVSSPISLFLAHTLKPPCWSLLIHSISRVNTYFFSPLERGAQLILEATGGFCWRLVSLGL